MLKPGQNPEAMAQDCPSHHQLAMPKPLRPGGFAHEISNEDADPGFGSGAAFVLFARAGFVLQSGC